MKLSLSANFRPEVENAKAQEHSRSKNWKSGEACVACPLQTPSGRCSGMAEKKHWVECLGEAENPGFLALKYRRIAIRSTAYLSHRWSGLS